MGEASVVQWGSAVRHTPLASLTLGTEVPLTISDEADGSPGHSGGGPPVLGGFVAGGELAWRSAGPTVEIIDPLTGVRKAAWTFGAIMHTTGAKVTNVCGVGPGAIAHVAISVDLGADRKPQGMVAVLSLHTSRIIRTFHFPYKVTSLCMVSGGEVSVDPGTLSQELQVAHGLLALGTHHGTLHLLDLALDCKELTSDEVSPASIVQMSVPDPQAETHRIQMLKRKQHPTMCLSDGMVTGNQFRLIGPDENILYKTPSHLVTVTTLTFLPQLASLVVGYNFGSFQIINLSSIAVDCASPHEENMHPVHSFALQEPENDPKNFVYLWICRSYGLNDTVSSKSVIGRPALCTMYAMSYENKVWIEGHGLWYQHLSSISPRFEFEAIGGLGLKGQAAEPSRVFSAQTVRQANPVASSGAVALTNPDDESGPVPEWSLCLFGWYGGILSHGKVSVQHYIAVFDINQWYQAHMPSNLSVEESTLCPYMSFHALDQIPGHITNKEAVLAAAPKPASWARHISKCNNDNDWFPASLSFSAHVLTAEGLMEYQCRSVQQAALSTIARTGPPAIVNPEQAYALATFAGLLQHNDLHSSPQNMTMIKERDALLNVALEQQQMYLLMQCVAEFAEGRYTHRGCSLPTLLDWTWNKVHQVKASVDTLCSPLFDPSCGVISAEGILTLHQNLTTLSSLTALTQAIKDNSNSITAQGAAELENRVMVVSLVQQYLGVVLWFYHCGLLSHSPVDDMLLEEAQVPFPADLLARIYNNRRIELKRLSTTISGTEILLIDGLIEEEDLKSAVNSMQGKIGELWEREGGCNQLYPPPSLYALLAVFLLPGVQPSTKHRIVQYLFLDLASLLSDGYVRIVEELVKYPSSFSLSPSHIKLTQAFWLIDHKDFQEGLNVLLDPLVNSNDISPEQHRRIIKAFLYQGESSRALTYAQIRQPPKMDLDDIRLHLTLLLANGRVREAFHYQRTHRVRDNTKDLLHHLFTGCEQLGRLESVVHLPLSGLEETELLSYLRTSTHSSAQDYLLVYYLQRARYSEAAVLQEGLRNAIGGVRKRHLARSSLLHAHITHLPDVAKRLATGSSSKPQPSRTIVHKPQPLSAQIRQTIISPKSYASNIAREMARVQGVRLTPKKTPGIQNNAFTPFRTKVQRRKFAELESEDPLDEFADMFNQTRRNVSRDASHVVFPTRVDMNRSTHQSRILDEEEYEYCSPAKRSRLSEVSMMREETSRLMESVLKRSMSTTLDVSVTNTMHTDLLSLLQTPTVGKRPVPTSLSSIDTQLIDTPQSILKVRNFVKRPMSPSAASDISQGPRFPRLPGTKKLISDDGLKVPSATPSEASTTPKQIRFDLPGITTNGQSSTNAQPALVLEEEEDNEELKFDNEEDNDVPGEACHIARSGQTPTPDSISLSRSPTPRKSLHSSYTETTTATTAPAKWLLSDTIGIYEDAQETFSEEKDAEISAANDEEDMEAIEQDQEEEENSLKGLDEQNVEQDESRNHELEENYEDTEDVKEDSELVEQEELDSERSQLNVSHIPTPRKPLHSEAQAFGEKVDQEMEVRAETIVDSSMNKSVNESYYSIGDTETTADMKEVEEMVQDENKDGEDPQVMEIQPSPLEDEKNMNNLEQSVVTTTVTEIVTKEVVEIITEDVVDNTRKETENIQEEIKESEEVLNQTEELDQLVFSDSEEENEDRKASEFKQASESKSRSIKKSESNSDVNEELLKGTSSKKENKKSLNVSEYIEPFVLSDSEESDHESEKVNKKEATSFTSSSVKEVETNTKEVRKSLNSTESIPTIELSDSEEEEEEDLAVVNKSFSEEKVEQQESAETFLFREPANVQDVHQSLTSVLDVQKVPEKFVFCKPILDNSKQNELQKTEESQIEECIPPMVLSDSEEEDEIVFVKERLTKEKVDPQESSQKPISSLVENSKINEIQKTEVTKVQETIPPIDILDSEEKEVVAIVEREVSEKDEQKKITEKSFSFIDNSKDNEVQKTDAKVPKGNENVKEMDRPLEEFLSALQESPEKFLFREPENVQDVHQSLTSVLDVQKGPEKFVFCEPEVVNDVRNSPRVFVEVYHDAQNPDKMVIEVKKCLGSPRRSTPDQSPKRNTPDRSPRRNTSNRSPGRSTPNRSPGRATPDRTLVNRFGEYQTLKNTSVHEKPFKNIWNYAEEIKISSTDSFKSTNDGLITQKADPIPVIEEPCVVKHVSKCGERESSILPAPEAFKDSVCGTATKAKEIINVEEVCIKETMWTCGEEDKNEIESLSKEKKQVEQFKKSTEITTRIESQEIIQHLEVMDVEITVPKDEMSQTPTDISFKTAQETVKDTEKMDIKNTPTNVEGPTLRRSRRHSESIDTESAPSTPSRRSKRIVTPSGTPLQDKPSTPTIRTRRNSTSVEMEASSPATAAPARRTRRASISIEQPSKELGIIEETVAKTVAAAAASELPAVDVKSDVNSDTITPGTPSSRRLGRTSVSAAVTAISTEVKDSSDASSDATTNPITGTPATPSRRTRRASLSLEKTTANVVLTPATPNRRSRRTSLSVDQSIAETETTPATPTRGRRARQSLDPAATSSAASSPSSAAASPAAANPSSAAATPTTTPSTTPLRRGRKTSLIVEVPTIKEEMRELNGSIVISSISPATSVKTPSTPIRKSSRQSDAASPFVEGEALPARSRSSRKNIEKTPSSHSKISTPKIEQFSTTKELQQVAVNLDAALNTVKNISEATSTDQSTTTTPVGTPMTTPSKRGRKSVESPLTPVTTPSRRSKRMGSAAATPTPGTPSVLEAISEESSVNTSGELSANVTLTVTPHTTPVAAMKLSGTPAALVIKQSTPVSKTPTKTTPRKRHQSKPSTVVVETLEPISEDVEIKAVEESTKAASIPEQATRKDTFVDQGEPDTPTKRPRGRPKKSPSSAKKLTETESTTPNSEKIENTTVVETLEPISEDVEIKAVEESTEAASIPEQATRKDTFVDQGEPDTPTKMPRGRPKKSPSSAKKLTETKSTTPNSEKIENDTESMITASQLSNYLSSETSPKNNKESESTPPSRPMFLRRSEASVRLLSPSVEVKTWSKRKSTRLSMLSNTTAGSNTTLKPRQSITAVKLAIEEEDVIELTPQLLPKSRTSRSMAPSDSFVLIKTQSHEETISEQDSLLESIAMSESFSNELIMEGGLDNEENTEEAEDDKDMDAESPELSANLLVTEQQPDEAEKIRRQSRRRTSGFQGQSLRRKLLKRSIQAVKLPQDGPTLDESSEAPDTKSRRSMRKSLRSVDSTIISVKSSSETITELSEENEDQTGSESVPVASQNDESKNMVKEADVKAKDFVFSSPVVEGRRVRNQETGKPPKRFSPSRDQEPEEDDTKKGSTKRKR